MKNIKYILLLNIFCFALFFLSFETKAQITKSYGTPKNRQGFHLKMVSLHNEDSLRIYVRLQNDFKEWESTTHISQNFVFEYYVMQDYRSAKTSSVKVNPQQITKEEDGIKFYFQIARQNVPNAILFFEMTNILDNTKYNIDLKISFTNTRLRDEFAVFQQKSLFPCFDGYVFQNEVFSLKNIAQKEILIRSYFYNEINTDMALAPMNLTKNTSTQKKQEDIFAVFKSNANMSFTQKGLCFFKKDSADFYGLSLRIEDETFPKIAEKTDLVAALTYILNNNEIEKFSEIINGKEEKKDKKEEKKEEVKETKDSNKSDKQNEIKQELDRFFLILAEGNQQNARNMIKRYYQRVKEANIKFSNYKDGWKTDMGMVYVLLGTPTETIKGRDVTQWTYLNHPSFAKAIFTFSRRANPYTDEYYTLARYTEYGTIWQLVVDNWRK